MTILIVTAAQFEADPIIALLNQENRPHESFICGIGALDAARNSAALQHQAQGKDVIFAGSCGIFAGFKPLEIVECQTVHWLPYGLRVGKSYKISGSMPPVSIPAPVDFTSGARLVDVICASTISLDPYLPPSYDPVNTVENIELFCVSTPILASSRSFRALLGVTNAIGPDAHQQWRTNFAPAAVQCAKFIGQYLRRCYG